MYAYSLPCVFLFLCFSVFLFLFNCVTVAFEDHCNEEVTFHAAEKLVVADWTKLRMRGSCSVNVTAIPDDADETGNQLLFSILRLRTPTPKNSTIAREHERTEATTDEEVCPIIRLDILDAETGKNITRACHVMTPRVSGGCVRESWKGRWG